MPTLPDFGKPSSEWSRGGDSSSGGGHEFFIKNFQAKSCDKNGHIKPVQILDDDTANYIKYYQHFDYANKISYPCAIKAGADECIGCSYPSADPDDPKDPGAKVREISVQWLVPVLDHKGYISVYAVGVGLYTDIEGKATLYGSLKGSVWAVVRTANENNDWNSVKWSIAILPQEKLREVKYAVPTQIEMKGILAKKYIQAAGTYGYDVGGGVVEDQGVNPPAADEAQSAPQASATAIENSADKWEKTAVGQMPEKTGDLAADALAAHKANAEAKGVEPEAPLDFDVMKTEDLKAFLDGKEVDYSSRAPRSVLVGIAKKTAAAAL